jgi:predicted glycoside hydrolase/deacetylase ChbG (UPF0249 family)
MGKNLNNTTQDMVAMPFDFSILIHADDMGASPEISKHIEHTVRAGLVSGVSVMANGPNFEASMRTINELGIPSALHLNLTLGQPSSKDPHVLKMLCSSNGEFKFSFFNLLMARLTLSRSQRQSIGKALQIEIGAQIECYKSHLSDPKGGICLDGHQHIHSTPIVRDCLLEISNAYKIERVRIPRERIAVDAFQFRRKLSYLNLIKCLLLNFLSIPLEKLLKERGLKHNDLMIGILNSGQMTFPSLLASLKKINGSQLPNDVQILLHPGYSPIEEENDWNHIRQFQFFNDTRRLEEYSMALDHRAWKKMGEKGIF